MLLTYYKDTNTVGNEFLAVPTYSKIFLIKHHKHSYFLDDVPTGIANTLEHMTLYTKNWAVFAAIAVEYQYANKS